MGVELVHPEKIAKQRQKKIYTNHLINRYLAASALTKIFRPVKRQGLTP
jgi:hypothetical protein